MGGEIWVESAPGKGSKFHFTAEVRQVKSAIARPVPPEIRELAETKVLVVDENESSRRLIAATLRHWSLQVELAADGTEGLAAVERAADAGTPFRLILLDAQLPGSGALGLIQEIHGNPKTAGAALLIMTSAVDVHEAGQSREIASATYLTKPVVEGELVTALRSALTARPAEQIEAPIARRPVRQNRRRMRVLLAEDNAVNRQLVLKLLGKYGHLVTVATNGAEAVDFSRTSVFDVVLMDVQMPLMDGYEATAAIRKDEEASARHLSHYRHDRTCHGG